MTNKDKLELIYKIVCDGIEMCDLGMATGFLSAIATIIDYKDDANDQP